MPECYLCDRMCFRIFCCWDDSRSTGRFFSGICDSTDHSRETSKPFPKGPWVVLNCIAEQIPHLLNCIFGAYSTECRLSCGFFWLACTIYELHRFKNFIRRMFQKLQRRTAFFVQNPDNLRMVFCFDSELLIQKSCSYTRLAIGFKNRCHRFARSSR